MRTSFFIILVWFNFNLCFSQNSFVGNGGIGGTSSINDYEGTSYAFTGINVVLTAFNGVQYYKGKRPNSNAGFALLTGVSQLLLPKLDIGFGIKERVFDNLNYISGTATIVIGSLMLLRRKKKKEDGVSFLPYVCPYNEGVVIGVVFSRN